VEVEFALALELELVLASKRQRDGALHQRQQEGVERREQSVELVVQVLGHGCICSLDAAKHSANLGLVSDD
jgi:hypothetical protein